MNYSNIDPKINPRTVTPEQAMSLSDDEKLAYFWRVRVKHERVETILADLETMVLPGSGTDIALLIGPTGVGKSTLGVSLGERIIELHQSEMMNDLSFIPAVYISAPASGEKKFSWRIFYIEFGKLLKEPLMDKKQVFQVQDGRISVKPVTTGSTVAGLRMAVEDALRYRRTLLVVIDEAVHLIRGANTDARLVHMDALKALTQIDGVNLTLALIGSYDLYDLMTLSGQFARRTAIVHFQRYLSGKGNEKDEKAFTKSLDTFQKYFPFEGIPDLTERSEELQYACIGSIGTLKETLQRMLTFVARNKGKWTDKCLFKALLTEGQIAAILEETLKGEQNIAKVIFGTGKLNVQSGAGVKVA